MKSLDHREVRGVCTCTIMCESRLSEANLGHQSSPPACLRQALVLLFAALHTRLDGPRSSRFPLSLLTVVGLAYRCELPHLDQC